LSVHDEGYSRKTPCVLNLMSTFLSMLVFTHKLNLVLNKVNYKLREKVQIFTMGW